MITQRRKAEHAAAMSYEMDNGGSSPTLPDFWDDDAADQQDDMERQYQDHQSAQPIAGPSNYQTPLRQMSRPHTDRSQQPAHPSIATAETVDEEEFWAMEAARAEEAEKEAEEAEMARLIEESNNIAPGMNAPQQQDDLEGMDIDMDMDWEMDSD
jgi:hypothetical protein